MNSPAKKFLAVLLMLMLPLFVHSQTRKRKPAVKKATPQSAQVQPSPSIEPTPAAPPKKNERPNSGGDSGNRTKLNSRETEKPVLDNGATFKPTFFYEFSRPGFVVSRVKIEHDDSGKGAISFLKNGLDDMETEPIALSAATLEKISAALAALNFFDSTENYQYEKNYSHLGDVTITVNKGERSRTVKFNWTENKDAKTISEEYRKIGNKYIWMFDITVARENQPLQAPGMMEALDSMIRRNDISDPSQMIPFLQKLADDERIPLIARNHADRIIKQIEKEKK